MFDFKKDDDDGHRHVSLVEWKVGDGLESVGVGRKQRNTK